MNYTFEDVTISVFDLHTTELPLKSTATKFFQKDFDFLIDAPKYIKLYESGNLPTTSSFNFRPLRAQDWKTHFWKGYMQTATGDDWWKTLTPFVCRPAKDLIKLNQHVTSLEASVQSVVYLAAWGWSTNILIRLRGEIDDGKVSDLMRRLINKERDPDGGQDTPPLLMADKPTTLTDTFKFFQERLLEEVYVKDHPPHDNREIPRHYVLSLNKFRGDPVAYKEMSDADKGLMRGMLFGKSFGAFDEEQEEAQEHGDYEVLLTQISQPYNFALTNFKHGTLLFLQEDALNPKKEGAVHCVDKNITACIMMSYALLWFYTFSKNAPPGTDLYSLRQQALNALRQIPEQYTNRVCDNLFRQHSSLRKLIAADESLSGQSSG